MDVQVRVVKVENKINFGDVFVKDDTSDVFMLHNSHDQIKLISFSGQGTWTKYNSQSDAIERIGELVNRGTFKHYPKDQYKLALEKK